MATKLVYFGLTFLMTGLVVDVSAQSMVVPNAQPQVEACYQISQSAADGEAISWDDTEPCRTALQLTLNERSKVATLSNLALMQMLLGDFDTAQSNLDEALTLSDNYADIYLNRANLSYLKRDFDASIRDYGEAIRLNPKSLDILYLNRGMAYQNLEQYDLAESDYRAALLAHPGWTLVVTKLEALEAARSASVIER